MKNKNKTVLVTASAKRLGKIIATDLVKLGWSVAIHYNKSKQIAEETANDLIKMGGNVTLYQANFSKNSDVEKLIKNLEKNASTWSGLINNAGYFNYDTGINFDMKSLNDHMSVNFIAPTILTKALANFTFKMQKEKKKQTRFCYKYFRCKNFWIKS